ncbi:MAG TPA: SusD/RagB family nutrient-binding outer membrane lipoprotein [Puia sp.]|nr:SusD/RagB family nutrient-binding outer membrane lipoprotein [Puia sp.]
MYQRIKLYLAAPALCILVLAAGCKKGTFDINSPNPNRPSQVSSQFLLSAALGASANSSFNAGFTDFADLFMGYWAFSGDYGGYGTTATYNLNNGYGAANWDYVYNTCLVNYQYIIKNSQDPKEANYLGIAEIMEAFHYQRLVDIYNNVPYSQALQGGTLNYPKYDDAATVYTSIVHKIDSGIAAIKAAPGDADNPGNYDIMFGGDMTNWILFGNTVKLKILLNLTAWSGGGTLISSELSGMTADDFLPAGTDAAVNPGYSNSSQSQQTPIWQNVGFTTGNGHYQDHDLYRACSYAVNFYQNHNDPRADRFYALNNNGIVKGRAFGSQDGSEHNTVISAVGPGILQSYSMSAYILPAFESLFLQAEALQRGYIGAGSTITDAQTAYKTAVEESFRIMFQGTSTDYMAAADTYIGQNDAKTNWAVAPDPITLIITQEWAALNVFDPITSWNNWKRLGIPNDLPTSIYPGTVAAHPPIRLIYPTDEYTTNSANANAEGTIDVINSKIFWMP